MAWSLKERCRKRISRESGVIIKDPGGKVQIALAYPNTYYVGMSNLGFLSLYHWLNDYSDIVAERLFLPDADETPLYEKSGAEAISLETQRPISAFDVLAFSIAGVVYYTSVIQPRHKMMTRLLGHFPEGHGQADDPQTWEVIIMVRQRKLQDMDQPGFKEREQAKMNQMGFEIELTDEMVRQDRKQIQEELQFAQIQLDRIRDERKP